jgi:signal peptidase I
VRPFRRRQPRPDAPRPERRGRLARAWRGFRRATDRFRILRDVLGALVLVGVVLGIAYVATGGKYPPLVVVESGSMMHAIAETSYGRVGTLDVGDIVFLRDVDSAAEVHTWAEGGEDHYGRPGDVIAYAANGDRANASTPIILRAIAWVDVDVDARGGGAYHLHWTDGQVLSFGPEGIYFPPLGFHEAYGFTPASGFRPTYDGFLTKGDNWFTNPAADQAIGISGVVDPSWIEGTIHGEVPWMGLGKLALQSGRTNPAVVGWERIGNAFAPVELWTLFFLVVALAVLVPFTLDTYRAWRRHRERRAFEKRSRAEAKALRKARRQARREPVPFTPVVAREGGPPRPVARRLPPR